MCESEHQEEGRVRDSELRFSSHFTECIKPREIYICDKTGSDRGQHLRSGQRRSIEESCEEIDD